MGDRQYSSGLSTIRSTKPRFSFQGVSWRKQLDLNWHIFPNLLVILPIDA